MTKISWTMQNGDVLKAGDSFGRAFARALTARGRRATRHMRVGQFSVVVLDDVTLAVARVYDERHAFDGSIKPDSGFWSDQVHDRRSQLAIVETRVVGHPLEREIREDMRLEIDVLNSSSVDDYHARLARWGVAS